MEIIDSHHHLWDTDYLHYTLLDTILPLNRPYTINDFESVCEKHVIRGSVCVEAASAGANGLTEIRWLLEQANRSFVALRLIAWVPLDPQLMCDYLDYLNSIGNGKIVGVRHSFEFKPSDYPGRDEVINCVKTLARYGYSFDLVFYHRSLASAIQLVKACPEVHFILDHLGKPDVRQGDVQTWHTELSEISKLKNLDCKISGLPTEADQLRWTPEQLKPFILHAIDCFGWDRVMFGSDWPVCNLAGGYERWLDAVLWTVNDAGEANQRKLFFENAWRTYKFNCI